MPDWANNTISRTIAKEIRQSRREVTILFTDIVYSTMHWELNGDIKGRLMVDKHNRLLFPVVQHYRGKVIKTIGDSIMAMFERPNDALRAAIGIQQVLERMRQQDSNFAIHVRIGMHTGQAIVEPNDVYGDVVNVASRIESEADGDEIFLSDVMGEKLKNRGYFINKAGIFTFKGKKDPMTVYRCDWAYCKDMAADVNLDTILPVNSQQKREYFIYAGISLMGVVALYYVYLRFFISDLMPLSLRALNPGMWLRDGPLELWLFVCIMILLVGYLIRRISVIPPRTQRLLKGCFGSVLAFLLFYLPSMLLPDAALMAMNSSIYASRSNFVTVRAESAVLHNRASPASEVVRKVRKGDLMLYQQQQQVGTKIWYEVLIEPGLSAWIQSIRVPKIDIPGEEIGHAFKYRFTKRDLFALLCAVLGFIWGVFDFRVRPA
jgi:class 3 adenylate cyclase